MLAFAVCVCCLFVVYLYGEASATDYRKTVPQIRAGEYEGLQEKVRCFCRTIMSECHVTFIAPDAVLARTVLQL